MVCDDSEKALKLMKNKSHLKVIIILENIITDEANKRAHQLNIKLLKFKRLRKIGLKNFQKPIVSI